MGGCFRCNIRSASPVEFGSRLDGERGVIDVPLNVRGGHQDDVVAAYGTDDLAEHDHALAADIALDPAPLGDDDLGAGHIAFELAVDLELALADNLYISPRKLQIPADYHLGLNEHDGLPFFIRGSDTRPCARKLPGQPSVMFHVFDCGQAVYKRAIELGRGANAFSLSDSFYMHLYGCYRTG